jgi:hypothetical protein
LQPESEPTLIANIEERTTHCKRDPPDPLADRAARSVAAKLHVAWSDLSVNAFWCGQDRGIQSKKFAKY